MAGEAMYYDNYAFENMVISLIPRIFQGQAYLKLSGSSLCDALVEIEEIFEAHGAANFTSKIIMDDRRVATLSMAFIS